MLRPDDGAPARTEIDLEPGLTSADSVESVESSESLVKSSGSLEGPDEFSRSYTRWSPVEEGVTLAWRDLSVSVITKSRGRTCCKRIINSVTGAVKPGSLVAVMGSSGAGKSTLMQALGYRHTGSMVVEGDILVNGRPVGDFMHRLSGYLHQEDLFVGSLTVLEHMMYMARLKLDRRTSHHDRQSKVYDILTQFGLIHRTHTRIGHTGDQKVLSGGEKKRLALATEFLTDPSLLFLDEPTTGLDSYSAQKLIHTISAMAARGRTILCSIHQPSSALFAMFGQVLLLAEGRVAWLGSTAAYGGQGGSTGGEPVHLGPCPAHCDPAEHLVAAVSGGRAKALCDQYAVSEQARRVGEVVDYQLRMGRGNQYSKMSTVLNIKSPFWWTRLHVLLSRTFLECLRDPSIQGFRLLQKIAIAVMVGLCYLGTDPLTQSGVQSVQGAVFILTAENTFTPMYSVLDLFPRELPLFLREHRAGLYSIGIYYVAKILAILPGLILEPAIFGVITYLMSGLRYTTYALSMTIFIVVLTMNVSTACGCFFSTAFNSVPTAMAYLVPFDVMLMVTQGVFIKLSSLPIGISLLQYVSWLMYSTESMLILQWENVQNITCEAVEKNLPCLHNGAEVLEKLSFDSGNFERDVINMVVLYLIFHILAFIFFWRRVRTK